MRVLNDLTEKGAARSRVGEGSAVAALPARGFERQEVGDPSLEVVAIAKCAETDGTALGEPVGEATQLLALFGTQRLINIGLRCQTTTQQRARLLG